MHSAKDQGMQRIIPKLIVFCSIGLIVAVGSAEAQEKKSKKRSFDVEKFLKRLDVNQNGKVEPGEIKDDRTRSFLQKAGVNTSKSISIKGFAKKMKKERAQRSNSGPSQRNEGFAVSDDEREEAVGESRRFAVSDEEREPAERARTREFSEGAKKMLDWVMKNYDKNKDGKIDSKEIKAARWADPPAHVSDTNRDGSLSKMELLIRYQKREDEKARSKGKSSAKRSSSRSGSRWRDGARSTSSRRESNSSKSNSAKDREVRKGYESYVAGLFKTYDKNGDGQLDKDEIDKMRRKPKMTADKNGDKKISKSELLDSYLEKAGQKTASSGKSNSGKRVARSTSASGDGPGTRPPLTSRDKNRNGQIEMAEFASDWTVEKVEEFQKKDTNRDGIITAKEWNK